MQNCAHKCIRDSQPTLNNFLSSFQIRKDLKCYRHFKANSTLSLTAGKLKLHACNLFGFYPILTRIYCVTEITKRTTTFIFPYTKLISYSDSILKTWGSGEVQRSMQYLLRLIGLKISLKNLEKLIDIEWLLVSTKSIRFLPNSLRIKCTQRIWHPTRRIFAVTICVETFAVLGWVLFLDVQTSHAFKGAE